MKENMYRYVNVFFYVYISAASLAISDAFAAHSDIWILLENNKVTISPDDLDDPQNPEPVLVDATTGNFLYLGDFGDFGGGPLETDDPGVQSPSNSFISGNTLYYQAVGSLWFWNGSDWVNSVPDQERIVIEDTQTTTTYITTSDITDGKGEIQDVDGAGGVHTHVDFSVAKGPGGTGEPADGVYLFDLIFVIEDSSGNVVHTQSDPVRIALGRYANAVQNPFDPPDPADVAAAEADFDAAIEALTNPTEAEPEPMNVPVPVFTLLILASLFTATVRCR